MKKKVFRERYNKTIVEEVKKEKVKRKIKKGEK